jgi:hypothetical protein
MDSLILIIQNEQVMSSQHYLIYKVKAKVDRGIIIRHFFQVFFGGAHNGAGIPFKPEGRD